MKNRQTTRRQFFRETGQAMIAASLGTSLCTDLGLGRASADEGGDSLTFGELEPLVALLQETPAERLMPMLVSKLQGGLELKSLVAAGALANARSFGGEDYVGFHTMMALGPVWEMSREMPDTQRAMPVLKVLYRNSHRIAERGGRSQEVLKTNPQPVPGGSVGEHVRAKNRPAAESTLAAMSPGDGLNAVLDVVEDATEVHRIVLIWRAWDLLNVVGADRATTMLRQSVRYCHNVAGTKSLERYAPVRKLIPTLFETHRLDGKAFGTRVDDDRRIAGLAEQIFRSKPEESAGLVAEAIAAGTTAASVAEAIRLAANELILRDRGRPKNQTSPNKGEGSIHGDGIGVHACDSANAWCNLSRVANPKHAIVTLLLGAYQVALDRADRGGDFLKWDRYPTDESLAGSRGKSPEVLLKDLDTAIRRNDQMAAAAATVAYGQSSTDTRPLFDLFRGYAISEDGALHAEKFYRTTCEAWQAGRESQRLGYLTSLARVTASAFGQPAPGMDQVRRLLKG
jgi:hypothetical protein